MGIRPHICSKLAGYSRNKPLFPDVGRPDSIGFRAPQFRRRFGLVTQIAFI
jgi:hypothetical protein